MIYARNIPSFDGYTLLQRPGVPSRFVKKSESNLQQDPPRNLTYWDRYKTAQNFYHLRPPEEVEAFADNFVKKWQNAASQMMGLLKETSDSTHLNPNVEATTKRAFLTTLLWLFRLFRKNEDLPGPDIVPNGDGGIDIEWTFANRFISVQIHKSNPNNDRIYYKKAEGFASVELNANNLLALLNE